jgi:hypothetical protein
VRLKPRDTELKLYEKTGVMNLIVRNLRNGLKRKEYKSRTQRLIPLSKIGCLRGL